PQLVLLQVGRSERAQTSALGNRDREIGAGDGAHARLEDRVLDPQQFAEGGAQSRAFRGHDRRASRTSSRQALKPMAVAASAAMPSRTVIASAARMNEDTELPYEAALKSRSNRASTFAFWSREMATLNPASADGSASRTYATESESGR